MRALLQIYKRSFKKNNFWMAVAAIFFMLCDVLIALVIPLITKDIFDEINSGRNDLEFIYKSGAIVILVALAAVLTTIINNIYAQRLSTRITADLRRELFDKIQDLSFSNVDSITTGTLMTVVTNDTSQIQQLIMMSFRVIIRSPLTLIGAIIASFIISKDLFFIVLICVPVLVIGIVIIIKIAAPTFTEMQKRIDDLNSKLIETVNGAREIKAFVTSLEEGERFEVVNENYNKAVIKANKRLSLIEPVIILVSNLAIGAVLVVASYFVSIYTGDARTGMVGTISAYINYLQQIIMSLMMISMVAILISRGVVSAKRIASIIEIKINIVNSKSAISNFNFNGKIEYKNVEFGYLDEDGYADGMTLQKINFIIKPHSTTGIIGSTGSGKTTLIQLIPRLYDATAGEVLIDNINVKNIDLFTLRNQVSYVTQEPIIFSGTIASNIRQGKEDATEREMVEAAKLAVAYEFIEKLDKGFDTEVTQGGASLSGGQRQRLALARALIRKPKILILDDSTSAVDAKSESLIKENIKLSKKQTTIIVAQKISSIRSCDNIIVLDNSGKIDGYGPHESLLVNSKVYKEIYTSQFGGQHE